MLTELCPHMTVFFSHKKNPHCFNCSFDDSDLNALCSLDLYGMTGSMFTTIDEFPKKVQETCPMHYTYEDIVSKQKAFEKHIAKICTKD